MRNMTGSEMDKTVRSCMWICTVTHEANPYAKWFGVSCFGKASLLER
jgi:hypothetical protein